jgi:hypothetical protein
LRLVSHFERHVMSFNFQSFRYVAAVTTKSFSCVLIWLGSQLEGSKTRFLENSDPSLTLYTDAISKSASLVQDASIEVKNVKIGQVVNEES